MRTYNGAPAHTAIVPAGTELWRVHRTDSRYPANSFNSTGIAPLTDAVAFDIRKHRGLPRQGRFDCLCQRSSDCSGSKCSAPTEYSVRWSSYEDDHRTPVRMLSSSNPMSGAPRHDIGASLSLARGLSEKIVVTEFGPYRIASVVCVQFSLL